MLGTGSVGRAGHVRSRVLRAAVFFWMFAILFYFSCIVGGLGFGFVFIFVRISAYLFDYYGVFPSAPQAVATPVA